jgi:hypothetical protein
MNAKNKAAIDNAVHRYECLLLSMNGSEGQDVDRLYRLVQRAWRKLNRLLDN